MGNRVGVDVFQGENDDNVETFEHSYTFFNDYSLNVITGKKANLDDSLRADKVIFFIHGVAGCSYIWHKQLKYFAHLGYLVICFDLIGHGNSKKSLSSDDYTFANISKDCLYLFDQFRATSRTNVVVGHSYGCSMASVIAHDRPKFVSRLILISGGNTSPLGPPKYISHTPLCLVKVLRPLLMSIIRKTSFHRSTDCFSTKRLSIGVDSHTLLATMKGQVWEKGDFSYHAEIKVPTLIMHGLEDRIVSYEDEWDMKYAIPNSTLHFINDVGHFAMLEAPIQVNTLIKSHIDEDWASILRGPRPARFYRVGSLTNRAIKRGLTLYRKMAEPKFQMLDSFSQNESVLIPEDFEIVGQKSLPPTKFIRRKSTIRRGHVESFQPTTVTVIVEENEEEEAAL